MVAMSSKSGLTSRAAAKSGSGQAVAGMIGKRRVDAASPPRARAARGAGRGEGEEAGRARGRADAEGNAGQDNGAGGAGGRHASTFPALAMAQHRHPVQQGGSCHSRTALPLCNRPEDSPDIRAYLRTYSARRWWRQAGRSPLPEKPRDARMPEVHGSRFGVHGSRNATPNRERLNAK